MKRIVILLISVFCFSTSWASLQRRVGEELIAGHAYPCGSFDCPTQKDIESYQYIFVDGFTLGFGRNFFPSMTALTSEFGVRDIVILRPESAISIFQNAQTIYEQILTVRARSPQKKALIIAHSKGAAETLLMGLLHPDLFTSGYLTDLVLVDGAFNGTPLADLWIDVCKNPNIKMSSAQRDTCAVINKYQGGLISLRPTKISPVITWAMNGLAPTTRSFLSRHIWAIQSQWSDFSNEWRSPLWIPHLYLQKMYGNNDGVILTENEKLPLGFGTNLAVFLADHNSLLGMGRTAEAEKNNESFARALIREMIYIRNK